MDFRIPWTTGVKAEPPEKVAESKNGCFDFVELHPQDLVTFCGSQIPLTANTKHYSFLLLRLALANTGVEKVLRLLYSAGRMFIEIKLT